MWSQAFLVHMQFWLWKNNNTEQQHWNPLSSIEKILLNGTKNSICMLLPTYTKLFHNTTKWTMWSGQFKSTHCFVLFVGLDLCLVSDVTQAEAELTISVWGKYPKNKVVSFGKVSISSKVLRDEKRGIQTMSLPLRKMTDSARLLKTEITISVNFTKMTKVHISSTCLFFLFLLLFLLLLFFT